MKEITMFEANDGTIFKTADDCKKHNTREFNFKYYFVDSDVKHPCAGYTLDAWHYRSRTFIIAESIENDILQDFLNCMFGKKVIQDKAEKNGYYLNWQSKEIKDSQFKEWHTKEKVVFLSFNENPFFNWKPVNPFTTLEK